MSRILVGHKYCEEGDYTEAMRVVPRHDAEEFAKHYGLSFCEVDSQTGENIEGVSHHIPAILVQCTCIYMCD